MVSGAFADSKVEDFRQLKNKLNHTGYLSLLQHHTVPSGTRFVAQGFMLMQGKD